MKKKNGIHEWMGIFSSFFLIGFMNRSGEEDTQENGGGNNKTEQKPAGSFHLFCFAVRMT